MYTIVSLYIGVVLNVHNSFTIHRGGIKCTGLIQNPKGRAFLVESNLSFLGSENLLKTRFEMFGK